MVTSVALPGSLGSFLIDFIFNTCTKIIINIIIKKGRQCKVEREWYTPYQSDDPSPTIQNYWQKEEKGKKSRRL